MVKVTKPVQPSGGGTWGLLSPRVGIFILIMLVLLLELVLPRAPTQPQATVATAVVPSTTDNRTPRARETKEPSELASRSSAPSKKPSSARAVVDDSPVPVEAPTTSEATKSRNVLLADDTPVDTSSRIYRQVWPSTFEALVRGALDAMGAGTRALVWAPGVATDITDVTAAVAVQRFADDMKIPPQLLKVSLDPDHEPEHMANANDRVRLFKTLSSIGIEGVARDGRLQDHYESLLTAAGVPTTVRPKCALPPDATPAQLRRAHRTLRAMKRAVEAWLASVVQQQYTFTQIMADEEQPGSDGRLKPLAAMQKATLAGAGGSSSNRGQRQQGVDTDSDARQTEEGIEFPLLRQAVTVPSIDVVDPPLLDRDTLSRQGKVWLSQRPQLHCTSAGRACFQGERCPRQCNTEYLAHRRVSSSSSPEEELLGDFATSGQQQKTTMPVHVVGALDADPYRMFNVMDWFSAVGAPASATQATLRDCGADATSRGAELKKLAAAIGATVAEVTSDRCTAVTEPSANDLLRVGGESGAGAPATFAMVNGHGLEAAYAPRWAAERLRAIQTSAKAGKNHRHSPTADVAEIRVMWKRAKGKPLSAILRWNHLFHAQMRAAGFAVVDLEPDVTRHEEHWFTFVSVPTFIISEAWMTAASVV